MSNKIITARTIRNQLDKLGGKIKALEKTYEEKMTFLQGVCKHPVDEIVEATYRESSVYAYATPPFRVCKLCGYAEEGWHCGYWKLAPRKYSGVPTLDRDSAYKYVLRFYSQDKMSKLRYQ